MVQSPLFGRFVRTTLDPKKTALLLVDVQKYFTEVDHPFGRQIIQVIPDGANAYFRRVEETVIPNIKQLLAVCRSNGAFVAFTEFGSLHPDGQDMPLWARRHNDRGKATVGAAVYPSFADNSCRIDARISPNPSELVIQKNTSGVLNAVHLDQTLRALKIDTVLIAGLVTDVCVSQAAREFGDRDFDVVVVEDACATVNEMRHLATLEGLATSFATIGTTNHVLGMMS